QSSGGFMPSIAAIAAMLVLCVLQLLVHVYNANGQAEVEAQAALALVEHQVSTQGEASLTQPSKPLLAALKPRESVTALAHCSGQHCDLTYARAGGAVCSDFISWPTLCASVMSRVLPGETVRVSY